MCTWWIARGPLSKRIAKYHGTQQSRERNAAEKTASDARAENAQSAEGTATEEEIDVAAMTATDS